MEDSSRDVAVHWLPVQFIKYAVPWDIPALMAVAVRGSAGKWIKGFNWTFFFVSDRLLVRET